MNQALRVERARKNWTQKFIEAAVGIPQARYSLIERGMPPKPQEAEALSKLFGLPVGELFADGR